MPQVAAAAEVPEVIQTFPRDPASFALALIRVGANDAGESMLPIGNRLNVTDR
jgi:hypothetical protein